MKFKHHESQLKNQRIFEKILYKNISKTVKNKNS